MTDRITVHGTEPYDVLIGTGALDEIADLVGPDVRRVAIVQQPALGSVVDKIEGALTASVVRIEIPDGEAAKTAADAPNAEAPAQAAPAKPKGQDKGKGAAAKSTDAPAEVNAQPTENPAPDNEAQANPPAQSVDAPPKAAKAKSADKPTAKTPSTKNAAPAKGGAKKSPKK